MHWAAAGVLYAVAYAALISSLADAGWTRTLAGNVGLLLPPLCTLFAIAQRRSAWRGRQAVFWAAIGTWAALWFVGQLAWASDELFRATLLPWFKWPIILQLCASAIPLIALVAWPHRGPDEQATVAVALDATVLVLVTGFLYWSLIIAPGMEPSHSPMALRALAIVGPSIRLGGAAGFLLASLSAGRNPWAVVYRRFALGMILAFAALVVLSMATVRGDYQTGAPTDVGWMLPFFFAAWAVSASPVTPAPARASVAGMARYTSPILLFGALMLVPVLGYGIRFLAPVSAAVDRLRDLATAVTVVATVGLALVRLRIERRAADDAYQRVRLLATACEQAGELVVIVRRDSRIDYANDAFCRATGYTAEELETVPPAALVAPASADAIATFNASIRERKVTRVGAVLQRKDASTFEIACAAAPIVDATGRVTHFVAVIRDVTDEIRLREQVVRNERLSAVGEFVAGVAHQINNPLQSVIGTLELAIGDPRAADIHDDLERARFEAGRAGRIVRNLLTFIRQSPNERVLIDLNDAVKATMDVRRYELEMASIQLREEYAPLLPLVLANHDEIQQVLLNLVINAQQAMTHLDPPARQLSIRTYMEGIDAVLEVRDSGAGIPAEIAGKIFEPFYTTKPSGSGTGLGLSLSLGLAAAHRGRLEHVPTPTGACFRLTLPGAGFPGPALAT